MKKKAAAFTIVRDEPFWLRVWCNYHCSCFPQEDVYVLDNNTEDDSVAEAKRMWPGMNVVNVQHTKEFDSLWLKATVEQQQRSLLRSYEAVLFSEADEFLIADPSTYSSIYSYCLAFVDGQLPNPERPNRRAKGWGIVHQIDTEPPVDRTKPLLADRNSMWGLPDYNKTLITRVPITYSKGFHLTYSPSNIREVNKPVEPELSMLHAWHIDLDVFCERYEARAKKFGNKVGVWQGHHDRKVNEQLFRTRVEPWWTRWSPLYDPDECPVPESWKPLLKF